ncbi:hypothetical protein C6P45_000927 [Maudiozyma exigua]|uniref:Mif2/CENP-C cupin domain-containing protein n=1 Tax=Maudiozyma exigua TaxID=34358 RepID=A0A9P6W3T3_MAUEX|nr:hypothetical protein C6P45_000927 [Kazachstania exigua]
MDFMDLGVTSRKTGLRIKNNIAKDEYNMENLEDFFKDDKSSMITVRKRSRKASLGPSNITNVAEERITNGISRFSTPHIFSPAMSDTRRLSSLPLNTLQTNSPLVPSAPDNQVPIQHRNSLAGNYNSPFLEPIHEEELSYYDQNENPPQVESLRRNIGRTIPSNISLQKYNTTYDLNSTRRTSLLSERQPERIFNPYTDSNAPDLVNDGELTIDNTSFNTSDNAILEEEMSEYEIEPDNDDDNDDLDYDSDMLSSGESSNDESDEENDIDFSQDNLDSLDTVNVDKTYIPSDEEVDDADDEHTGSLTNHDELPADFADLSSDEDEEYLPSQGNPPIVDGSDGVRRSTRVKVPPLEYWRNERIVYQRKNSKPYLDIDKIVTFEQNSESEEERETKKRKKRTKEIASTGEEDQDENSTSDNIETPALENQPRNFRSINNMIIRGQKKNNSNNPDSNLIERIERGQVQNATWIQDGFLEGTVNSSLDEKSREIIAYAPNISQAERTRRTNKDKYTLSVMFDKYKDLFASGILTLPASGMRDSTESHNAFITFYVIEGVVEVTVGINKFITPSGCSFQVPSFNSYSFRNKGRGEVKLFFVQVIVPDNVNSQEANINTINRRDISSEEDHDDEGNFSDLDDEPSRIINLKNRHISNSQTKIKPSSVPPNLFLSSSSSDLPRS